MKLQLKVGLYVVVFNALCALPMTTNDLERCSTGFRLGVAICQLPFTLEITANLLASFRLDNLANYNYKKSNWNYLPATATATALGRTLESSTLPGPSTEDTARGCLCMFCVFSFFYIIVDFYWWLWKKLAISCFSWFFFLPMPNKKGQLPSCNLQQISATANKSFGFHIHEVHYKSPHKLHH